jgi:muramoyltetrapeptide carboxypeptidase
MLTQLRLAGVIETASALVFGEFRDCDEPRGEPSARGTLADLVKDFKGPVVFGFPSGHTRGPLVTLPFGIRTRVVADGTPRVIVEESAVE